MSNDFPAFSKALRRLLARPELRDKFMQVETSEAARAELGVAPDMATELKIILAKLPAAERRAGEAAPESASGAASRLDEKAIASVTSAEDFLDRSFRQLRTGARVMMGMSVTMFLIGVAFLVIAGIRAFTHPESAQVTGVIAGVGVVQIVYLFYRNPLRHIGRAISNAQQAKMIVMSYMLGVSLIAKSLGGKATKDEQKTLDGLTQRALEQLERFTEASLDTNQAEAIRDAAAQATKPDKAG